MKIVHTELAQKGDVFVKGDRVAVDAERGKGHHTAKSWWLGTVMSLEGTKIRIKHDDDGESDLYPYSRSQTEHFIKLPKNTPITKRDLTGKQVKALMPRVQPKSAPQVKTPSPKTVKPVVTPRERDVSMFEWIRDAARSQNGTELDKVLTEAEYRASSWLGVRYSTGRLSSTTSSAILIGMGHFKGKFCTVSLSTGSESLLYSKTTYSSWGHPEEIAKQVAAHEKFAGRSQMPYREFCNLRMRAAQKLRDVHARHTDQNERSAGNMDKFYHKIKVGSKAYIRFRDYPSWKTIEGVDFRKNAIGISGSGSKLRWIPLSYVLDVKEAGEP